MGEVSGQALEEGEVTLPQLTVWPGVGGSLTCHPRPASSNSMVSAAGERGTRAQQGVCQLGEIPACGGEAEVSQSDALSRASSTGSIDDGPRRASWEERRRRSDQRGGAGEEAGSAGALCREASPVELASQLFRTLQDETEQRCGKGKGKKGAKGKGKKK